jgi:hypothetical protein
LKYIETDEKKYFFPPSRYDCVHKQQVGNANPAQALPGHSYLDFRGCDLTCTHQHGPMLKNANEQPTPAFLYTWSCWLMTPSLIFEPLSQQAGSVVLASGTLSLYMLVVLIV